MRITDVRVTVLDAPIPEEFRVRSGVGLKSSRNSTFVEVLTDEGLVGLGSCVGGPPAALRAIIDEMIAPTIRGQDPFNTEALWQQVFAGWLVRLVGPQSVGVAALSGVDIALWDLKGKALGVPIYQLLGGAYHDPVRVYASSVYWQTPEGAAAEARRLVDQGFTAVKLKVGSDVRRDIATVAAVREAVGDDIDLFVDANLCYTFKLALALVRELERHRVFWFEEPIPFTDLDGHKRLAAASTVRIATGENMYTRVGFQDFINHRAVDIVQPEIARCGGITEAKKIAAMAGGNGVLFAPHSFGDAVCQLAALHVIASCPEAFIMEMDVTYNPLRTELGGALLQTDNGFVALPTKPGLGVELTDEIREAYSYRGGVGLSPGASPILGLSHDDMPGRAS